MNLAPLNLDLPPGNESTADERCKTVPAGVGSIDVCVPRGF
jgi:hypothetical protein